MAIGVATRRSAVWQQWQVCGCGRLIDRREQEALVRITCRVYGATRERPETERKAAFLSAFAAEMPTRIATGERIVGSQCFTVPPWGDILGRAAVDDMAYHGDLGHIVVDSGGVLEAGVRGLRRRVEAMAVWDDISRRNQVAFAALPSALSRFIGRHASLAFERGDDEIAAVCRRVSQYPSRTFHEALQFAWFVQLFLHAESPCTGAFSLGRLDQWLFPF